MAIARRPSERPSPSVREPADLHPPVPVEQQPEAALRDLPLHLVLGATTDPATRERMGRGAEQSVARLQHVAGNAAVARLFASPAGPVPAAGPGRAPGPVAGGQAPAAVRRSRVAALRRRWLQRLPFSSSFGETLLTEPTAAQQAAGTNTLRASGYAMGATDRYQMTRDVAGVRVQVRIYFKDPSGTPLPAGDARRTDATSMCSRLVGTWNDKYEFHAPAPTGGAGTPDAGVPAPGAAGSSAGAPRQIVLPVRFVATAVFDPHDEHDTEVNWRSNVATGEDNAATGGYGIIDAGNWFSNIDRRAYPADPAVIYAHEYGHLIGIPDEYSLSNAEAHGRIHGAAPGRAEMDAELDRQGAKMLMLIALCQELYPRLRAGARTIAALISGQRGRMAGQLVHALRSAWNDGVALGTLKAAARAALAAQPRASRSVDRVIDFEARRNRGYGGDASGALDRQLAPDAMGDLLERLLERPLATAHNGGRVTIPFTPGRCSDRDINVQIGTFQPGADTTLGNAVSTAAGEAVGALPAPVGRRAPAITPSPTLLGRLAAMPARWSTVADMFGDEAGRIPDRLASQGAAVFADPSFAADVHDSVPALYRATLARFNNLAGALADTAVSDFLTAQFAPAMQAQVDELVGAIETELGIHRTVPPRGGTDAAPPAAPDPVAAARTRAIADALHTAGERARTMATAASPTGVAAGSEAATDVHVSYTIESLMGANEGPGGAIGRPDYLAGMLRNFNDHPPELRHAEEPRFSVRRKTT